VADAAEAEALKQSLGEAEYKARPAKPKSNVRLNSKLPLKILVLFNQLTMLVLGSQVCQMYDRLVTAISVIEDMEGLARGYYHGASLVLQTVPDG